MKQGKRPTRAQKMMLRKHRLDPPHWLVMRDDHMCLMIRNRVSGQVRTLNRVLRLDVRGYG